MKFLKEQLKEAEKENDDLKTEIEQLKSRPLSKGKPVTGDYNDYVDEGSYMINAFNMKNSPHNVITGVLLVLRTGAYIAQFLIGTVNADTLAFVRKRDEQHKWWSWKQL